MFTKELKQCHPDEDLSTEPASISFSKTSCGPDALLKTVDEEVASFFLDCVARGHVGKMERPFPECVEGN